MIRRKNRSIIIQHIYFIRISNRKGILLRELKLQDLGLGNTACRQLRFGITHFGVDALQQAGNSDWFVSGGLRVYTFFKKGRTFVSKPMQNMIIA